MTVWNVIVQPNYFPICNAFLITNIDQSLLFLHMIKLNYFNGQMPYISMQISLEAIPEVILQAIPF